MTSRYEAYMDGIALSSVDPSIYVLDIHPGEVKKNIRTSNIAGRMGSRITRKKDESTSVNVLFEIHEYDTVKRQAICQKVQKWADGDILTVSDRPDQFLRCVCESYPSASAKEWTKSLAVGFVAYNPPYWQENNQTTITVTTGSSTVYIPGNAPETLVSATVTVGASISSCTLSAGSKTIVLDGISASVGDVIALGYDDKNILHITLNGTSIMEKRTASSADDLTAVCGENNTFSAPANCSTVFTVRGCWY